MKAAVLVFPGSNCDRDMAAALSGAGFDVTRVWHKETTLPAGLDLIAIPGGFSFGDYLRCGAIAARAPAMAATRAFAEAGGLVLGVCNGFQVLLEAQMLPGALMRNAGISFICRDAALSVETADSPFTRGYARGERVRFPVAHHDGCWIADDAMLARLRDEDRIAFRYAEALNGSVGDVAGVLSANRRVLGLMPHPERAADPALGGDDGARLFSGLIDALATA